MAEQPGHEKHDELVSPIAIPKAREDRRIEVRGQVERQGEREGKDMVTGDKENNNLYPSITPLPRAVKWLGGELLEMEMVEEVEEGIDQHPDKGLISGSSNDGLSHEKATEEGEDAGRGEEGEEGRVPRTIPVPVSVTKAERQEHELTHTPYRSWCEHCVRCRGRNSQHRKKEKDEQKSNVPRVAFDYFFMSHKDESANENPMLIMLDEATGDKYARAVGQKGLGGGSDDMQWLVADLHEELKAWGHHGGDGGHIILKSDNESPIVTVRDALARHHGGKVVIDKPPKYESQSNGSVEEAGKQYENSH